MNYIPHVFVVCLSQLMISNLFGAFSKMEAVSVSLLCIVCLRINESKFFYRHFKLYLTATAEHFSEKFQALIVDGEGKEKEYRVQWQDFFTGHVVGQYGLGCVSVLRTHSWALGQSKWYSAFISSNMVRINQENLFLFSCHSFFSGGVFLSMFFLLLLCCFVLFCFESVAASS